MLVWAGGIRVAHTDSLPFCHRAHAVRDDAVIGKITAANHITCAGSGDGHAAIRKKAVFIAVGHQLRAAFANRQVTVDVTPPVITCSSDSIDASVTAGDEALLQGVMASDDRDGDLTDQILIKGVSPSLTDSSAQVTYIVFDSANNMASVTRTVRYTD